MKYNYNLKTISVSGHLVDRVKAHCARNHVLIRQWVEAVLAEALARNKTVKEKE